MSDSPTQPVPIEEVAQEEVAKPEAAAQPKSYARQKLEARSRKSGDQLHAQASKDKEIPDETIPVVTRKRRHVVFSLGGDATKHKKEHRHKSEKEGKHHRRKSKEPKRHKSGEPKRSKSTKASATLFISKHSDTPRKQHRFKPGTRALMDIKRLQWNKREVNFIPKSPFNRLINEILLDNSRLGDLRMTAAAREALRVEAEAWCVRLFSGSNQIALSEGRTTVFVKHMQFFQHLCQYFTGTDLAKQMT